MNTTLDLNCVMQEIEERRLHKSANNGYGLYRMVTRAKARAVMHKWYIL